jgi:hypothetical protein
MRETVRIRLSLERLDGAFAKRAQDAVQTERGKGTKKASETWISEDTDRYAFLGEVLCDPRSKTCYLPTALLEKLDSIDSCSSTLYWNIASGLPCGSSKLPSDWGES